MVNRSTHRHTTALGCVEVKMLKQNLYSTFCSKDKMTEFPFPQFMADIVISLCSIFCTTVQLMTKINAFFGSRCYKTINCMAGIL